METTNPNPPQPLRKLKLWMVSTLSRYIKASLIPAHTSGRHRRVSKTVSRTDLMRRRPFIDPQPPL